MLWEETTSTLSPFTFVLFGATGDLAKRKLLPAFFNLYHNGKLPPSFAVIGVARRKLDDESFRAALEEAVRAHARYQVHDINWRDFARHFYYCSVDVTQLADFERLYQRVRELEESGIGTGNRMFYLAMAPERFGETAHRLQAAGFTQTKGWKRLIIEKPFGEDYGSAQRLNEEVTQVFREEEIFRIDHYLGKEMVQNIEVIRFANSLFEPLWNNRCIANVQITSSETVGVEERAAYYDKAGALRDMFQNHMLQMVTMIAMEPPSRLMTEAIRDEKVKVLQSLRPYGRAEVRQHIVRGQYGEGEIQGKAVPAYRDEPNVAPGSRTETFIAARLYIDNFRWAGVPFYVRTGKRMAAKATEIVIQFRDMPRHLYFNQDGTLGPNLLVIRVQPQEGMYLQFNVKRPGTEGGVIPVAMEFSHSGSESPEAYERLLHDALRGDSTFFTRWDEVALAWKFVDPIAEAFANDPDLPLATYRAGSWGPEAAEALTAADGFRWWPIGADAPVADAARARLGQPVARNGRDGRAHLV
ncbi:glucose-6-phosphate 1-dehydrogenase [Alicyclobacillus cellulosilyticus]|uniref:Glucose-6-phosphate 1-dehydrogenase n=1 Tax=Alicyclobacillus cellulosilyticus TaxID=1003997 RepID=A0A917K887_9BACL|nr:glucose-6-phosphate dehydrogenase [Alicyclobacillus cellulosilyticus]GGJ01757.1 glucose-6-phosphate 1-dehydrogenase [Alicyclobacillus cellulosilyticus]